MRHDGEPNVTSAMKKQRRQLPAETRYWLPLLLWAALVLTVSLLPGSVLVWAWEVVSATALLVAVILWLDLRYPPQ